MLQPGLRLDQAPPASVPFRFFLTAPLFLAAAAAVLGWQGPEAFASRGTAGALAFTHLLALGFMTMAMLGAMMQMLPVIAATPVPKARGIAAVVHIALTAGTPALAAGFLMPLSWLLQLAIVALGAGFAVFIGAAAVSLTRVQVRNQTVRAMWLAVLALLATVVLGGVLAAGMGWAFVLPNASLRELHPAWGLLGWMGLLVVGVACEVVPMLQMTPRYPRLMSQWFPAAVIVLLVAWSLALWLAPGTWNAVAIICAAALAIGYLVFSVITVMLQQRRRRRQADVSIDFWRISMASLAAAVLLWTAQFALADEPPESWALATGVLAFAGFGVSIVTGMLYKIVTFLSWFHLQAIAGGKPVPNMKQFLPDSRQRLHFWLHAASVALLLGAAFLPDALTHAAALALGVSAVALGANLAGIMRVYRDGLSRIEADVRAL